MIEKEVIAAIEKDFIPVSIDVSIHALPLNLKAEATPSFIFVDKNAKVLLNVPGAWGKIDFLALLKEARESLNEEK
jgi:thioredoxin-related protein